MVIDSSALIAILMGEPNGPDLFRRYILAPSHIIGAPTAFESAMVLSTLRGSNARILLTEFLVETKTDVVPFDQRHWPIALSAFLRYGKGHHPARLNLGDCLTYATAKVSGQPLLFIGDDFRLTDLEAAL